MTISVRGDDAAAPTGAGGEDGGGDEPAGRPPGRHRRRRVWLVLGVVVLAVAAVAAVVVVRRWGSDARPVSTEEAQRRFGGSSSTIAPESNVLRPPAGVYLYRGNGSESLSLPPKTQDQGPALPGTVTHRADGCWAFRIDYSTNHWQDWTYCPRDGGLVELGGRTHSRWDFVFLVSEDTTTFTCDPAAVTIRAEQRRGAHWDQRCTGTSSAVSGEVVSAGPYAYVGPDTVSVGGTEVATHHFRQERRISGAQHGEQTTDLWFAEDDGLPVRNERRTRVVADTPFGSSTYTEQGMFTLAAPGPEH